VTSPLPRTLATLGHLGAAPVAGGLAAQAFAVAAAYALHRAGGFPLLLAATAVGAAVAYWAVAQILRRPEGVGDRGVVLDVVVGQWIALWPLSFGLWRMGAPADVFPWPGWVGAFVVFRLLLAWRPWPVRRAGAVRGARGVLLDDAAAGALTALAVLAAAAFAHGWLR
jgi:phosphatidylglycerophosphatase A